DRQDEPRRERALDDRGCADARDAVRVRLRRLVVEFKLTEGQENIKNLVHWLGQEKVRKHSLEADKAHRVPDVFLRELQQMGITGGMAVNAEGELSDVAQSKDAKGTKQTARVSAIAAEEMAWGDAALILAFPGPGLGGPPVRFSGTPEQKKRFFAVFKNKS